MPLLPTRHTLRSRWSTLLWAAGICLFAVEVAGSGGTGEVNAAALPGDEAAQAAAAAADG